MFENVKVGDSLYDVCFGWGRVKAINCLDYSDKAHFIEVEFSHMKKFNYSKSGINLDTKAEKQTLFFEEMEIRETEKIFSLEKELAKLEIKEFECGKRNYSLYYNLELEEIKAKINIRCTEPFRICFTEKSINTFLKSIEFMHITQKEFFEAYKNVFFWR